MSYTKEAYYAMLEALEATICAQCNNRIGWDGTPLATQYGGL